MQEREPREKNSEGICARRGCDKRHSNMHYTMEDKVPIWFCSKRCQQNWGLEQLEFGFDMRDWRLLGR